MTDGWGLTKEDHDAIVAARNGRPITQDPIRCRTTPPAHVPKRTWLENFLAGLIGETE